MNDSAWAAIKDMLKEKPECAAILLEFVLRYREAEADQQTKLEHQARVAQAWQVEEKT
jgi:hypothetical protein